MGVVQEFNNQEDLVATIKMTSEGETLPKEVTTTADVAMRKPLIPVLAVANQSSAL